MLGSACLCMDSVEATNGAPTKGVESDLKSRNSKGIDPMALAQPAWLVPLGTRGDAKA
jgi:hypothetical protein